MTERIFDLEMYATLTAHQLVKKIEKTDDWGDLHDEIMGFDSVARSLRANNETAHTFKDFIKYLLAERYATEKSERLLKQCIISLLGAEAFTNGQ